jgi:hypothetical protein
VPLSRQHVVEQLVRFRILYADERTYQITVTVTEESASATFASQATILEELLPSSVRGTPNQRFVSEVYRDMLGPWTVPVVVVPSPQSMEAVKSPAAFAVFVSLKVATGPLNEMPLGRVRVLALPDRLSDSATETLGRGHDSSLVEAGCGQNLLAAAALPGYNRTYFKRHETCRHTPSGGLNLRHGWLSGQPLAVARSFSAPS